MHVCMHTFNSKPFSDSHAKVIEANDLIELFVTSVAMLESDYDSVFVIAMKLVKGDGSPGPDQDGEQWGTGQPL